MSESLMVVLSIYISHGSVLNAFRGELEVFMRATQSSYLVRLHFAASYATGCRAGCTELPCNFDELS